MDTKKEASSHGEFISEGNVVHSAFEQSTMLLNHYRGNSL
jgi:hypothetical protein